MTKEEYKKQFTENDAVGWLSITKELEQLYPNQEPQHFGTAISYDLGGKDPLDGISIYESKKQAGHFHFVSYGFSELYYDEDSAGEEFSKFGFELTFRLKKDEKEKNPNLNWAMALMQNLAKYVFNSNEWFDEYHFIPANGPIRLGYDTDMTALAFVADPELGAIQTPNGEVKFLQLVGLTTAEFEGLKENPDSMEELILKLQQTNPLLITDLDRK